jgi:hypothetical protein
VSLGPLRQADPFLYTNDEPMVNLDVDLISDADGPEMDEVLVLIANR